jgi:hypothetical protein
VGGGRAEGTRERRRESGRHHPLARLKSVTPTVISLWSSRLFADNRPQTGALFALS